MRPAWLPRDRRRLSLAVWGLNLVVAFAFAASYCRYLAEDSPPRAIAFALAALLTSVASLSLLAGLPLLAASSAMPWPRALAVAHGLAWTLFHLALFVDSRTYDLFRFHLNATAWNMLTAPGAGDAVHVSPATLGVVGIGAALLAAVEIAVFALLVRRPPPAGRRGRVRPALAVAATLFTIGLAQAAAHARADLIGDRAITSLNGLPPGYHRLTVRRVARKWFGYVPDDRRVETPSSLLVMDYPKRPIELPTRGRPPNVVVLVADSLRADMLAPETMPRTWELSRGGRRFQDHLSGGNTTRFGVFSLLYGLHGAYWRPALAEGKPAVLVETFRRAGHDVEILATASLAVPEFRSTAFVTVADHVEDSFDDDPARGRDALLGDRAVEWIRQRGERPFFLFALLDASHQVYSFPPGQEIFTPSAPGIDYLALSRTLDPETSRLLFNRYRNSVHHVDAVLGRIVDALAETGALDRTIVVITADHGEEFGENGFWGHNSNFSDEQVRVPMVILGPGFPPGDELRPTCHVDVAPTLLESCGVDPALRRAHSVGHHLLQPPASRNRVLAGWDCMGAWTGEAITWMPLAGYLGPMEVRDHDWKRVPDQRAAVRAVGPTISEIGRELREFLR